MKRIRVVQGVLTGVALAVFVLACGGSSMTPDAGLLGSGGVAGASNAMGGTGMSATGGSAGIAATGGAGGQLMAMYPSWKLNDIQPLSPRANETYGLEVFQGQPVVAYLIEGF